MEVPSQNAFKAIFPRYTQLLNKGGLHTSADIENFVRNQLPDKIQMVRKMEITFTTFLNQYTNLILKRPQQSNLIHSLLLKSTERTDKYFQSLELKVNKLDKNHLVEDFQKMNFPEIRNLFRQKLKSMQSLLQEKYFANFSMDRDYEEQATIRLYNLFQIYHFTKCDLITASSRYRLNQSTFLQTINSKKQIGDVAALINLDSHFIDGIHDTVNKRCRPFINKRDFLQNKTKQILRESQSKVPQNFQIFLDSVVTKEKYRVNKEITTMLQKELRSISDKTDQEVQCKDIISQVEIIKKQFHKVKNNAYFIDIMRGNFAEKYKMELNKLDNLYYLSNLEKYLQDVAQFLQKLLRIEEKIIQNRKNYMKKFGILVDEKINQLINFYTQKNYSRKDIWEIIQGQFDSLQSSLYGVIKKPISQKTNSTQEQERKKRKMQQAQQRRQKYQVDRQQRQRKRQEQLQRRKQQEKQRKQEERMRMDQRRKQEQERMKKLKQERQLKERQKLQQQQRVQQQKKQAVLKKQEQRRKREQQQRQKKEAEARKRQQQRKKLEQAERVKKQQQKKEMQEKKRIQQEKKKRQKQQEERRKQQDRKRIEEDRKKREEAELLRKKKEQQDRRKKEEQRKLQQQRKEKQRRQRQEKEAQQKRKKQEEKKRIQQQKRKQKQAQQKKKRQQDEKRRKQEEQRQKQLQQKKLRQLQQKKKKDLQQKKRRQEQQRKKKQAQEKKRKEEQERKKIEQQKKKDLQQKKRKQQQQRKQKQQQQRLKKIQLQKKQKQEKQRKERQLKAKKQEQQRKQKQLELKKKKEEEQAKKKSKKQTKKDSKKSAVNYGGYDQDQLLSEQQNKPQQIKKPIQNKSGIDDQYNIDLDYEDDFDEESPQKGQQIETKELIGFEHIKCLNQYLKGTQYARKNKPNLEPFNNQTQYIYIFEELVQNKKLFIFETSISKALFDFSGQLLQEDISEDDLRITLQTIREAIYEAYEKQLQQKEFDPRTQLVFPFSFPNQLSIQIIEVLPAYNTFRIVLNSQLSEDEIIRQKYSSLVQAFLHVFEMQGQPRVLDCVLPEESKMVIDTFDKEMPNLLILFAMHYEHTFENKIQINQYTIDRFFYTSQILQPFYELIENQNENISAFYDELTAKYEHNEKVSLNIVQVETSQENYEQMIVQQSANLKQQFLQSKINTLLTLFQVIIEEEEAFDKINVYMEMSKGKGKPTLNYYIISKDQMGQESASQLFEMIAGDEDDKFQTSVYIDFTRHNGVYQYSEWTLPLWAHMIVKRKMAPINALRAITLSMAPYYVAFKQMD